MLRNGKFKVGVIFQNILQLLKADKYVQLITRCGKNGLMSFSSKCENVSRYDINSLIPIFDRYTGLSFRNIYCALCHRVSAAQLIAWPFQIESGCAQHALKQLGFQINSSLTRKVFVEEQAMLQNISILQQIVAKVNCKLHFKFSTVTPCHKLVDKCSANDKNFWNCKKGAQSIVTDGFIFFRNIWCANCHGSNDARFEYFSHTCKQCKKPLQLRGNKLSLSALLDFTKIYHMKAKAAKQSVTKQTNLTFNNTQNKDNTTRTNITNASSISSHEQAIKNTAYYCSITCISISTASTVLFAFVLTIYKHLRNKNALNLFILATFIIMTNVLYILMSLNYTLKYSVWLCKTISAANYFFNIATFFWSSVIACDICFMLRCSSMSIKMPKAVFKCLSTASFLLVCCLTAVAALTDIAAPNWSFSPHFGVMSCWFNSAKGHILFYFSPSIFTLILNFGELHCTCLLMIIFINIYFM